MMEMIQTQSATLSKNMILAAQNILENQPKKKMVLGVYSKLRDKSISKELGNFVLLKRVRHLKKNMKKRVMNEKRASLKLNEKENFLRSIIIV
jgi:hypothetical protein